MEEYDVDKRWEKPGVPTTRFLLDFYDACLREESPQKVALAFGCHPKEVYSWLRKSYRLREAQKLAGERRGSKATFQGYVFGLLSKEAKETWRQIQMYGEENDSPDRLELIFKGKTIKLRQELFVHALASTTFNTSKACRMIGINRNTLFEWMKNDAEFVKLVEELEFHKKNFIEQGLLDLVQAGHPGAVMFANKTKNADRGYSEKIVHEHKGQGNQLLDLDALDKYLDLDTKRKFLDAIRKKREDDMKEVVEAEVVSEEPRQLAEAV